MSKLVKLPNNWATTTIEQIAHIEMGQSPDSKFYNIEQLGLPFFQGKAEFGELYPEVRKWCSNPTKIAQSGDILLSIRAPVGPTNIAKVKSCIGRGLAAIRGEIGINQRYLFYYFRNIDAWLSEQGTGSTFAAINGQFLKQISCVIAPSNEQTRIVEKLEELLSGLDAGVDELKAAQKKLVQYRQSLLKAAVEGGLTAEWRKAHQPEETGAQLLERILKERRARWEAKQLAKFQEQGKTPPKDWQDKYPEPVKPDTSNLPKLPEGWVWASLDQLTSMVRNGLSQKPSQEPIGFPILRINAVRPMSVNLDEVRYLQISESIAADYFLENGDLLATRYNGSVDLLGVFGVVRSLTTQTLHPDKLIRIKPVLACHLADWIEISAATFESRRHIVSRVKTTAGQTGISGEDVKKMPIPLPPLAEQLFTIDDIKKLLPEISAQTNYIERALKQSTAQRKNILKAAFSGQLVPQDPNDEPVSVLLERIQAERRMLTVSKKSLNGKHKG